MSRPLSVERRQAMLRAVDYVTNAIEYHGGFVDGEHLWVKVHLLRAAGWSFYRIARYHGIPRRSAQRYEAEGRGSAILREAVASGVIDREEVTLMVACAR